MVDRNVNLDISATDRASGPLGRIDRQAQKLQETMEGFSGKNVASSFSAIARAAATGGRAIEREMAIMDEAIQKGERNLVASAKAAEKAAKDVVESRKRVEDAGNSASDSRRLAEVQAQQIKALAAERVKALKASSKTVSDQVVRLAKEERSKIEEAMAPRLNEVASLKGKRGKAAAERRKELAAELSDLRKHRADLARLEDTITKSGMSTRTRARAETLLGSDRVGAVSSNVTAEIDARIAYAKAVQKHADEAAANFDKSAAAHRKTLEEAQKALARQEKFTAAERDRTEKLRETRAKAVVMSGEFQGTAQKVFAVREKFDRDRDPREAARAIDGIAGANGEIIRTAAGQKRLSSAADSVTSSMKRQKAAVDGNRSALADLRHSLAGLLSLYMIIQTAVDQASKAVDAFRNRQAFESRLNYTNGADFQDTANQLTYVRELAQKYGLEIQELQSRYSSFATAADALGLSTEKVQIVFDGLSAAARVNKMSTDEYGRAITSLTQMIGKNQVMSEELKGQLAEAFPPAVGLFAKAMGYAENETAKFLKHLEDGRFKGEDVIKFAALLKDEFGEAAERAGDSFDAMLNRFRNSLTYAREAFAKAGLIDGLTDFMGRAEDFFESDEGKEFFVKSGEAAKQFLSLLGFVVENLDTIVKIVGSLVIGKIVTRFIGPVFKAGKVAVALAKNIGSLANTLRILRVAFAGIMGPLGLFITAVSMAVPWVASLLSTSAAKKVETAKKMDEISTALGGVSQAARDAGNDVAKLQESLDKFGVDKLKSALVEAKLLQGAASRDLKEATQRIIEPRTNGVIDGVRAESPSAKIMREADENLRAGNITLKTYEEIIAEMRKFGVINDEERADILKKARAVDVQVQAVKTLDKAVASLTDTESAKVLMSEEATRAADETKKKIAALDTAIDALGDKAGDDKGMRKAQKSFEDVRDESAKLQKQLDELKKQDLDPQQYADRSAKIAASLKRAFGDVTSEIFRVNAAAMGFDVTLGKLASESISSMTTLSSAGQKGTYAKAVPGETEDQARIRTGIIEAAGALGLEPADLATIISYETGGTMDPTKRGPTTQHGQHRGLIQFGEPQAKRFGVDWNDPIGSQLGADGAIVKYFKASGFKPGMSFEQAYATVNAGNPNRVNATDANNGGAPGTVRDKVNSRQMREHRRKAERMMGFVPVDATATAFGGFESAEQQRSVIRSVAIADSVSGGYGENAQDIIQKAFSQNPDLADRTDLISAIKDKRTDDVISILGATDSALAHEFRRASIGTAALKASEEAVSDAEKLKAGTEKANGEIADLQRSAMLAALEDDRKRFIEEQKAEIGKQVADGDITREAGDKLYNAKISEFDAKQAVETRKIMRDNEKASADRVADAKATNDLARARMEAERAADAQKLTGLNREKFIRDRINADQAVAAEASRRSTEDALQAATDANALAGQKNDLLKIELQERQKIATEDKASGLTTSEADIQARVKAQQDVYKANNPGWASAQVMIDFDTSALEAKKDALTAQLQNALKIGDTPGAEALKEQIRGVNDELLAMAENALAAMKAMQGPDAEKARATYQRLSEDIRGSRDAVSEYGQSAEFWGVKAGDVLSGGITSFAKAIAESENPWRALMSTVGSSVGQILIDIGAMIVKATIAKQVMAMLGMSPDGSAMPGSVASGGGGWLSKILLGGFQALSGTGGFTLPVNHSGGVSGQSGGARRQIDLAALGNLAADERLSITRVGEEVIPATDPRHISNVGRSVANLQRTSAAGRANPSATPGAVSRGGPGGTFASPIESAAETMAAAAVTGAGAGGGAPVINNLFDVDDFVNRGMATASGQRAILNVVTKNPKKFRAALGMP